MSAFHHEAVEKEYQRWKTQLPPYGYETGLSFEDVLTVHFILVDMFYGKREGLGGIGPKSLDLLISAISRQHVGYGDQTKWNKVEELVATVMYGIVLNHPFHDANKRTAFLSSMLMINNYNMTIRVNEKQFEDFIVSVADKSFRENEKYKREFFGQDDADILYIANYLKKIIRTSDKKDYIVTYRELNSILKRFGYELRNPKHNTIDVVEIETSRRVCNIGCHGMSKQVAKPVIRYVREETGLDFLSGCDSGAFFRGEQPLNNLLAKYYEPLERLAFR